jgi:hypothetical protein
MRIKLLAGLAIVLSLLGGAVVAQQYISAQITARVVQELPNASGITASIPLADVLSNLTSDSIESAKISIKSFASTESKTDTSLDIVASKISKEKPTLIGSLEITATIPAATITKSSEFSDAKIVDNTLQVSPGEGGFGTAILVPKHSSSQLYFEIQSLSILGNEIPASSLPADIKNQIKAKSQRSFTPPKGLKVNSVSLSSEGLSVKMVGSNIQFDDFGSGLGFGS